VSDGAPSSPNDQGERRWPMALAVLITAALQFVFPASFRSIPPVVYVVVLLAFLVVLVVGDPGRIDEDKPWLHRTTSVMIGIITLANVGAAIRLVHGIIAGESFTEAGELLAIGATVWVVNVIAFALWFWDLDRGGAVARATGHGLRTRAFVFPEEGLPEHADDGWCPTFVDYLALSFSTATAFSPTDVSAVKRWSKLLMMAESATSLAVALLVLARAINTLPT
jgi:hypothetical protein